jgi:hypothetical protein
MLALIGSQWLTITNEKGERRLDNREDFVRVEIETALEREIRVIPILELVHAYSNLKAGAETLPKLLARATSTRRRRERHAARQAQVRLDPHQARALATSTDTARPRRSWPNSSAFIAQP